MKKLILTVGILYSIAPVVWAKPQVVTLSVPSMNCFMCPITVRKALEKVNGVDQVKVDYANKTAMVRFDDQKTDTITLTRVTKGAGYPSEVIEQEETP